MVYINDIVQVSPDATCFLFADDTNLLITGRNSAELELKGQEALDSLARWSHLNGLAINKQKNQAIVFRCKNKNFHPFSLHYHNYPVEFVEHVRFLGLPFPII